MTRVSVSNCFIVFGTLCIALHVVTAQELESSTTGSLTITTVTETTITSTEVSKTASTSPVYSATISPTLSSGTEETVSISLSISESGSHEITVSPTVAEWIDVFFEVVHETTTPNVLENMLRLALWPEIEVHMLVHNDAPFPWIRISFLSQERAEEAIKAANNGMLLEVKSAGYVIPVKPTDGGGSFPFLAVIIPCVLFILVVVGFVVYFMFYRKEKPAQGRFDEDFAMNCATTPVNLNELLLISSGQELSNKKSAPGITSYPGKKGL